MHVVVGATSSIWLTSCDCIFLFVAYADGLLLVFCYLLFLLPCYSFSWCFFFLLGSVLDYFAAQISGLHTFALARFHFIWHRCLFFYIPFIYIRSYCTAHPLFPFHFSPLTLSDHRDHPCQLTVFSRRDHTVQNHVLLTHVWLFCIVFAFLVAYACIITHPNRYVPIRTHPWLYLSHLPKHHVRGNFPGHRAQILTCSTLNEPFLPCFCVNRAPCVPTHSSSPICTRLHLFIPVSTLIFHVYVYGEFPLFTIHSRTISLLRYWGDS